MECVQLSHRPFPGNRAFVNRAAMFAKRDPRTNGDTRTGRTDAVRKLLIELAAMIVVGLLLAALGPFDSYRIGDFSARVAYWVPASLIGYAIFRPTTLLVFWLAKRLDLPFLAAVLGAVAVGAVPGTIAIALFGGYDWSSLPRAGALLPLYFNVFLLGTLIIGFFALIERGSAPTEAASEPASRPPFLDRLSPGFPQPLVALEMEDHYVRAHGQQGRSELVLLRMRDAVAELVGVEGERVHRSWWVARAAVIGKRRDGRKLVLLLDGGLEAPVARDRVADLRATGWL